ncbi:MAG: acyl-CoA dehydrogenase, partial [Pseudomonadota bacterium]
MDNRYLVDIGALLNEEERLAWRTVRDFGERRIAPQIAAHYEAGTFPSELVVEFGELGLLGGSLDGYGGSGMGAVAYGLSMLELERQDSAMRSFCSVQSALVMWPIYTYGDEHQKQRWLPALSTGASIGAFGLTEPNSGSDPASMQTRAVQQGSEYVLNGRKQWITSSPIADVFVVWAQTTDTGASAPVIRGFVLERGMAGLSTPKLEGKLSLRASCTGEIVMDEVRVPTSNLLPGVSGLKGPLGCLSQARYGIGWGALGAAMAVYECALEYSKTRKQFGK